MNSTEDDERGLVQTLLGDGRPLLLVTGLVLLLSGIFALFLSATGHFLPHDVAYLGIVPADLCMVNECRIVHFMIHDRVSFGGALIGIGTLYLWITEFPLKQGRAWAWWALVVSGTIGFGSFLLYLGYGYLDTWHGAATLALLPCFVLGLIKTHFTLDHPASIGSLAASAEPVCWRSAYGVGRALLLTTSVCLAVGGIILMSVGATTVFVSQDLRFMVVTVEQLEAISPRLVPLIAHDRAGFGGSVCCCGFAMFFCVWCGQPSKSLWQALLVTGMAGFGTAIGVHPVIGYNDFVHLLPAMIGASMFAAGIVLTHGHMHGRLARTFDTTVNTPV